MTAPSLVFGFLLASIYGTGFHVLRGGGFRKLILYIILAWIGFWVGHFTATSLAWTFGMIGALQVAGGSLGSLLFLIIGYWLSLVEAD